MEFDIPFNFHKLSIEQQDDILVKFHDLLQQFNLQQDRYNDIVKKIGDIILNLRIENFFEEETKKALVKPKPKKTSKKQENE